MSIKTAIVSQVAKLLSRKVKKDAANAINCQKKVFKTLIRGAKRTHFGRDHNFHKIKTYKDFKKYVPLADYEDLKSYIYRINAGHSNVLWKGLPKYYAKTSGTTSGAKFIPLTKQSIPNHFGTARNAVFNYVATTGKSDFLDGKMIFLSGSCGLYQNAFA